MGLRENENGRGKVKIEKTRLEATISTPSRSLTVGARSR